MPALNKRATGVPATPRPPVISVTTDADPAALVLDPGAIMVRLHAQSRTRIPRRLVRILRRGLRVGDILAEIVKLRRTSRQFRTAWRHAGLQHRLEQLAVVGDPAIAALRTHLEVVAEIADAEGPGETDEWWDAVLLLSDTSLTILLQTMPTTPDGLVCLLEYLGSNLSEREIRPVLTDACAGNDPLRQAAETWLVRLSAAAASIRDGART